MRSRPQPDILGLFPSFDSGVGGVQVSGREAWLGIVERIGNDRAKLLSYDVGRGKTHAAVAALRNRRGAGAILVWHLDLLKLVPLLNRVSTRVFLFLHGIEAWRRQDALTRWALPGVHLFLSNSEHTWERFLEWNPGLRQAAHALIPLGLGSAAAARTPAPCGKPIALIIGRLERGEGYKGHREMIEAWPRVIERVPDAELWIAGDGNLRRDLEQLARARRLNGQVRFLGKIPENEKEKTIEQCRCLALPSRGEGFGLVYLEAMRMGRPCLVSNQDAGREVVNPPEAGLEADPGNPRHLAEAVVRLLAPGPEWSKWSEQARRRYETRFTAEHFRKCLNAALFAD